MASRSRCSPERSSPPTRPKQTCPGCCSCRAAPDSGRQRPEGRESWLDRALNDYRVLLLDQRGTGRSSPANRRTLARLGSARAQADYLTHFRADSIVLDAELIRRDLTDEPWSVLGQSFGGMCTVTYLSFAPHGIREAFIAGGLPGLTVTADDVYRQHLPHRGRQERRALRALPGRRGAGPAGSAVPGRARRPAAGRRAAVRGGVPVGRGHARPESAAATRCTTCSRTRLPATSFPTPSCTP